MASQAAFTVNGLASEDVNGNRGVVVANSATITLQLEVIPSGSLSATFQLFDANDTTSPLASLNAETLVFDDSGTALQLLTDPDNEVATFTFASSGITAYLVRCTTSNSSGPQVFERAVVSRGAASALRKTFPAESQEFEARGWSDELNRMVDAIESLVVGGGYTTVEDEGVPLTQRTTIDFVGAGVSAADFGGVTTVTITGGGGDLQDAYDNDPAILVDATGPVAISNATTADDLLTLTRTSVGLGSAMVIDMGPGNEAVTDIGLDISSGTGATGAMLQVNNLGNGDALDIRDAGGSVLTVDGVGGVLINPATTQDLDVQTFGGGSIGIVSAGDLDLSSAGTGILTVQSSGSGDLIVNAEGTGDLLLQEDGANRITILANGNIVATPASEQDFTVTTTGGGSVFINTYTFPDLNVDTFAMPDTNGAAGSVLTDVAGDGVLTFAAIPAGAGNDLQAAYELDSEIDVTTAFSTIDFHNDTIADTTTVLQVSRAPGTTTAGVGLEVLMGANTSGDGIHVQMNSDPAASASGIAVDAAATFDGTSVSVTHLSVLGTALLVANAIATMADFGADGAITIAGNSSGLVLVSSEGTADVGLIALGSGDAIVGSTTGDVDIEATAGNVTISALGGGNLLLQSTTDITLDATGAATDINLDSALGDINVSAAAGVVVTNAYTFPTLSVDTFNFPNTNGIAGSVLSDVAGDGTLTFEAGSILGRVASVTGILSGGEVTVNGGDPDKFDVATGFAVVADFTVDPEDPVITIEQFGPFAAEDPLNLLTAGFTILSINAAMGLEKSNVPLTPQERRLQAEIQTVNHAGGIIAGFATNQTPAYNVTHAHSDYIRILGLLNTGNEVVAAPAANLTVQKLAGVTTELYVNTATDPDDPTNQPNPSLNPITLFQIFQDSGEPSGFNLSVQANVAVGFWDDGSDTLVATTQWVNYYFYFRNGLVGEVIGQEVFSQRSQAEAARFPEPNRPADLASNTLRTILTVKGNVTDLLNSADVGFFQVTGLGAGSTGASPANLQSAYENGNEIAVDGPGSIGISDTSATDLMTFTRTFVGAGSAIIVDMGPGNEAVTGIGVDVSNGTGATGSLMQIVNEGSGSALDVQDGVGTSVFNINGDGSIEVQPTPGVDLSVVVDGAGAFEVDLTTGATFAIRDDGGGTPVLAVDTAGQVSVDPTSAQDFTVTTVGGGDAVINTYTFPDLNVDTFSLPDANGAAGSVLTDAAGDGVLTFAALPISYTTVEDEGSPVTQRTTIDFVGAGVSVADTAGTTTVTISGGGGGNNLQQAYDSAPAILVDATGPVAILNATTADDLMTLTRTFVGAGSALVIDMGPGNEAVTDIGLDISSGTGATGTMLQVNNLGSGLAVDIQDSGTSVFNISAPGAIINNPTTTWAVQDGGTDVILMNADGSVDVNPTSGVGFSVSVAGVGIQLIESTGSGDITLDQSGTGDVIIRTAAGAVNVDAIGGLLSLDGDSVTIDSSVTTIDITSNTTLNMTGGTGTTLDATTGNVIVNSVAGTLDLQVAGVTKVGIAAAGAVDVDPTSGQDFTVTTAGGGNAVVNTYTFPDLNVDTFSFPDANGAAGSVLTDVAGDGVLTFAAAAGGVSDLQGAYDGGNTIAVITADGPVAMSNVADVTNVLELSRTFAGVGNALDITMGVSTSGTGLAVATLGANTKVVTAANVTATMLDIDSDGSINIDGNSDGEINITTEGGGNLQVLATGTGIAAIANTGTGDCLVQANAGDVSIQALAGAVDVDAIGGLLSLGGDSVTIDSTVTTIDIASNTTLDMTGGTGVTVDATTGPVTVNSVAGAVDLQVAGATKIGITSAGAVNVTPTSAQDFTVTTAGGGDAVINTYTFPDLNVDTFSFPDVNGAALSVLTDVAGDGVLTFAALPSSYDTVEDEGVPLTQRTTIDFVGAGVTATDSGGVTTVTIGGGAGGNLQDAYDIAPGILVDATGPVAISNATTADDLLTLTRTFVGLGSALVIDMGPGNEAVTDIGLDISSGTGATGTMLFVNNLGSGSALDVQDGGTTVLEVTVAGAVDVDPTSGQSFTVTTLGAGDINLSAGDIVNIDGASVTIDSATTSIDLDANTTMSLTAVNAITLDGSSVILAAGTTLDVSDEDIINAKTVTFGTVPGADTSTSNVLNIDFADLQKRQFVLTENVTSVTFTTPVGMGNWMIEIVQASGLFSLPLAGSWPAAARFTDDTAPVAPAADGNVILLGVYYNGTVFRFTETPFNT